MKVNLVAVQTRLELDRYRSFAAFREAMRELVANACRDLDARYESLVVLPEGLGLFLSIGPYYYDLMKGADTVTSAIWRVGLRRWPSLLLTVLQFRTAGLRTALLRHGLEAREAFFDTFASLAKQEGVYIVGGTGFFPLVSRRPLKPPRIIGRGIYNVAPFFSPSGALLLQASKLNRASRWERRFAFAEGRVEEAFPAETAVGRVGVLICHDSLRAANVERMDALGAEVLAVPAYSLAPWHSKVRGSEITQEGAWLDHGLPRLIAGRENIRFAVCSMLVGSIFDLASEGRSFICRNTGDLDCPDIVASASSFTAEEVVARLVEIGPRPRHMARADELVGAN
jgi:predicted amidohydrolase